MAVVAGCGTDRQTMVPRHSAARQGCAIGGGWLVDEAARALLAGQQELPLRVGRPRHGGRQRRQVVDAVRRAGEGRAAALPQQQDDGGGLADLGPQVGHQGIAAVVQFIVEDRPPSGAPQA